MTLLHKVSLALAAAVLAISVPSTDAALPITTPTGAPTETPTAVPTMSPTIILPETDDVDQDGVQDTRDACLGTNKGEAVNVDGCSIDQLCPCDNKWKNHGQFENCVVKTTKSFVSAGLITEKERSQLVNDAGSSDCGKKQNTANGKNNRRLATIPTTTPTGAPTETPTAMPTMTPNIVVVETDDVDKDGVSDVNDSCLDTNEGDAVNADGCSVDQLCPCDNEWKNHGQFENCVVKTTKSFVSAGLITEKERSKLVSEAGSSDCGKKSSTTNGGKFRGLRGSDSAGKM